MKTQARSLIRIVLLFIVASLSLTQLGWCRTQSARRMEKHTRKMEKKLTKYSPGTYLRIVFRDHTESVGMVGRLEATSFTFTDAENNATRSYRYADVASVEKGETFVGEGSRKRHFPKVLVFGLAGALAGGAIATFTVER